MLLFALKLICVPSLLGLASIAARRWGPAVGGWFVALPLTSGPVLAFLALEQGPAFAIQAARGTLLGLVPLCSFYLGYAWAAKRFSWPGCVATGLVLCLSLTAVLNLALPSTAVAFVAGLGSIALTYRLIPEPTDPHVTPRPAPRWEIPFRMAVACLAVLLITGAATTLGPHLAGLLTSFPTTSGVLAPFVHREQGASGAIRVLRGVAVGLVSFGVFFGTVATLLTSLSLGAAFGFASLATLAVHWMILRVVIQPARRVASA
ncbi:MAG TPA: hypothetical protein VGI83_00270 [Gemmatimonadales bacterium]|jgi:uncharacterized membrane protein (GlpM family)